MKKGFEAAKPSDWDDVRRARDDLVRVVEGHRREVSRSAWASGRTRRTSRRAGGRSSRSSARSSASGRAFARGSPRSARASGCPGCTSCVGVAEGRVLVPCARIAEIARIVACDPVPGAAASMLGSFVFGAGGPPSPWTSPRGWAGAPAASLDAIMVILDGAPTVALVVDEVRGLVEDPLLADGAASADARLVVGACRVADEAVPVVAPEVLEREAQELA